MATLTLPQRARGRSGYSGPGYPTIDPRILQQAEQQRIAAQAAREQANIQARAEAARLLREHSAQQEAEKIKAKIADETAKRMAAFNLETTRTNSAWNLAQSKLKSAKDKPTIEFEDKSNPDMVVKRKMTEEQFAKFQADKKAEENAPKIAALQEERDAMAQEIATKGPQGWGGSDRRVALAKLDSQLKALQPPADLLGSKDIVAPAAPAAPAAPTPRGFIGSPGANTFLAEPAPLGMNRAETNAYAIKLNNQGAAPSAPDNLLRSDSFPLGYNPAHGSFQVGESAPVPQDAPMADFNPDAAAQQDLLSAPSFRPAVGDLRASESNLVAPVPQDAPMADFNPNSVDAPARPRIPRSHIEHLIKNPDAAKDFNAKYGDGTAEEILNR